VPERERWRTFHQFAVCWVALATVWTIDTGASAWLPIAVAVNAVAARPVAVWMERRRDCRAARE
jgi:predicted PurR-regulated permease PerM